MSNSRLLLIIGVVVAVGLAVLLWLWSGERAAEQALATEEANVPLYFPSQTGGIAEEMRQVADLPQPPDARARRVIAELLLGPSESADLVPLLPAGTEVDVAFVEEDGTCVIEFRSSSYSRPPQMGSHQEAELFASLLQSLSANVEGVNQVVVLWNGRQPDSFGGHFDTTRPVTLEQVRRVASLEAAG